MALFFWSKTHVYTNIDRHIPLSIDMNKGNFLMGVKIMKTTGEFVFIELKHIDAGSFIDDNGKSVSYKASWKLKVNEFTEYGIKERIFKIPENKQQLIDDIKTFKPYEKIFIDFNVNLYATSVKLEPIAVN